MDGYTVRPLGADEYGVLGDFLYEAIFIPEGVAPPPREIINQPELQVYVEEFGTRRGDIAVCARLRSHRRRNAVARDIAV